MINRPDDRDASNQYDETLDLLEYLLDESEDDQATDQTIQPRSSTTLVPLSFAQQRFWFLAQLDSDQNALHLPEVVRLSGSLDVAALEASLTAIVARHEVLRTTFAQENGQLVQVIHPAQPVAVPVAALAAGETEAAWVQQQIAPPFDLARGPLWRVALLRRGVAEQVLVVVFHHSIADGWSLGVFWRELQAAYTAQRTGQPLALPPLPIQYADYALWQHAQLQGARQAALLAFWREQLADAPALLTLPTDAPRPARPTGRGALQRFQLSREHLDAAQGLARAEGVTLFMVLLATWQVLLSRWSGQPEVVVGTPTAGRTQAETEGLIGCFVNTLALRTRLHDRPSVRRLLARVRDTALAAYAHQDLPFEQVVEALQPHRDLSYAPMFQVLFTLQNLDAAVPTLPGLTISPLTPALSTAQYDLTLSLKQSEDGLSGLIEYSSELFAPETITRLVAQYATLLHSMAAQPEQSVARLPLLPATERTLLLDTWNPTATLAPPERCIHALIAEQATRTPDALAVLDAHTQLSYAEMDRSANQLAHALQALGVGPEVCVALCLDRSPQVLVALLAVLKAGGCYLALDPVYPDERVRFMLHDSQAALVLTHTALAPRFAGTLPVLALETLDLATGPSDPPASAVLPDHPAYLVYTSGSTGQPKGVVVAHRALVTRTVALRAAYQLTPADRLLQFVSLSFDAAAEEVFPTLAAGAALVLDPDPHALSPAALHALVARHAVSVLHLPPAYWGHLVAEGWGLPAPVRLLITGGESPAPQQLAALARQVAQPLAVVSAYGPSEATITTTLYAVPLDPEHLAALRRTPIGRPLPHTPHYVLDEQLQPVPIGVVGELYLGGPGLARGYHGQPDLTAARFGPDPFSPLAGARMYGTGDRVRYLPDGTLEFVGRMDGQVKLRGYRVELGEIERVLGQHAAVQAAVVVLRAAPSGDRQLVAYVVGRADGGDLDAGVRAWLAQRLPSYLVPSAVVALPTLPLTPNGKVDLAALPTPAWETAPVVAPRTELEAALVAIWERVLGHAPVGVEANFFALGGHSLLAMQVVSQVRQTLGRALEVRALFEAPTVAALAARLATTATVEAEPIVRRAANAVVPLSFAQQRLWFLAQLDPEAHGYVIPSVLRLHGPLDMAALEASLTAIVARHEVLRTTFAQENGQPVQVIHPAQPVAVPVAALATGETEAAWVQQQIAPPFDLARGPLWRVALLRRGAAEQVLVVVFHHSIADGWSLGLFWRELQAAYTAAVTGQPLALPALPIQYADYALWQHAQLHGTRQAALLAFWREQLADAPALLELPTDAPRPAIQSSQGAALEFILPASLMEQAKGLARAEGVTLFMVLLATWQVLLSRWSGQAEVVVGTPTAGRTQAETDGLIGCFVNTLALRTRLHDRPSVRSLLARVRETALAAYAHQDLPFEQVVEALQPHRDLSYAPMFQVFFALQNLGTSTLTLPGLTVTPADAVVDATQYDLTLSLSETEQHLSGLIEYNSELFAPETIARLVAQYATLLHSMVTQPEQSVARLPLLPATERTLLLDTWNTTATPYPRDRCIHALIAEQASRYPEALAVVAAGRQLSYADLDQRANQLAHHLQALGVGPEICVAICMRRTLELPIAILGVLKAGGAYLLLDPDYPPDRLQFMIEDAHARVLLSSEHILDIPPHEAMQRVNLDQEWPTIARHPRRAPQSAVRSDNLAYINYTSGSTNRPKGAMISHQSLVNYALAAVEAFGLSPADRILQFTSISFDVVVEEIFPTWVSGATLVLRDEGLIVAGVDLLRLIERERITAFELTTAHWHELVAEMEALDLRLPSSLRFVLMGGERVLPERFAAWQRYGVPLIHVFGLTEVTVTSTLYFPPQAMPAALGARGLPIGRPIANTQLYVLDAQLQPVPIGVVGELYIGGDGLARGYYQRPELSAEKFVPNPFAGDSQNAVGSRLYKTGDRVRYLPDGNIEFLGRIDFQVKLRGFRIELGEIEAALAQYPGLGECIVVVHEAAAGDKRLVAYVTEESSADRQRLVAHDLRGFLQERLPEYMVPSAFVFLESLPLTPNGKIDRKALPVPDQREFETGAVAPRDLLELQLVQIWEKLLNVQPIGVTDNFFELGGHSLLAVGLITELHKQFGRQIPLATLFQSATIEQLAGILHQEQESPPWTPLVPLQPHGSKPALFCIHPHGSEVFCYIHLARQLAPDQPVYGVQAPDFADTAEQYTSIEAMAAAYITIIREQQPEGPYALGGWSFGGLLAFEMARQLRNQGQPIAMLALMDTRSPLFTRRINRAFAVDKALLLLTLAQEAAMVAGTSFTLTQELIPEADAGERLQFVLEEIRQSELNFPTDQVWIEKLLHGYWLRNRAEESYQPPVYDGEITLFRAIGSQEQDRHHMRNLLGLDPDAEPILRDPTYGWSAFSTQPVAIVPIPGVHTTLLIEPNVSELASKLRDGLQSYYETQPVDLSLGISPG